MEDLYLQFNSVSVSGSFTFLNSIRCSSDNGGICNLSSTTNSKAFFKQNQLEILGFGLRISQ